MPDAFTNSANGLNLLADKEAEASAFASFKTYDGQVAQIRKKQGMFFAFKSSLVDSYGS